MIAPDGNGRKYACTHGGEGPLSLQMEARRQLQAGRLHLATPPFPPPLSHTSPWGLAASENHGYNGGMGLVAPPKQPANPLRSARLREGGLNLGVTGQDRRPDNESTPDTRQHPPPLVNYDDILPKGENQ